jgi:[ribosomal protein S5]-alanine N-acetyltransferase
MALALPAAHDVIVETERLRLRQFTLDDAPFILVLVNDPAWLRFIGDRGVHDLDDARNYLVKGPMEMYAKLGYGLFMVELKDGTPAGMCGLLKRDYLDAADIGFAFLPAYVGKGLAHEAAVALMGYARSVLHMGRILAITNPENEPSVKLLRKLGFQLEGMVRPPGEERDIYLFATQRRNGA